LIVYAEMLLEEKFATYANCGEDTGTDEIDAPPPQPVNNKGRETTIIRIRSADLHKNI
jgi:hypothetical protein